MELAAIRIRSRIGRAEPPPVRAGGGIGIVASLTACAAWLSSLSVVVTMTKIATTP